MEENKTYNVWLSNDSCIFDHKDGFASPEEALDWASGRSKSYLIQIGSDCENDPGVIVTAVCYKKRTSFRYYDGFEWRWISRDEIIRMVK